MSSGDDPASRPGLTPAERRIRRAREGEPRRGRLSNQSLTTERTVESYLRSGVMPRFMERLREIHTETQRHRERLAAARAELAERLADRPEELAAAWRERVARWRFDDVNELIRQHNEWYPVERQLPMDPRTGDYVLIAGRPYRREELDADWALREFPPEPPASR
ncbi:MAG TPA: hypothetical protein VFT50_16210 [Baekduia sp.]|nr:hypothetical protein [Baekduia sp.]